MTHAGAGPGGSQGLVLHHFFVLTGPGAPQAKLLSDLGMLEGPANTHPGQGTANRRFFFANAMLELLYLRDEAEAASGPGRDLGFPRRAADPGASPFGLVFAGTPDAPKTPFPGWRYDPDYLEDGRWFHVGENSQMPEEPLCVYVPFELPAIDQPSAPAPFTAVTELIIRVPGDRYSPVLQTVTRVDRVTVRGGEPHRMDLVFNAGDQGRKADLRPELPLVVHW